MKYTAQDKIGTIEADLNNERETQLSIYVKCIHAAAEQFGLVNADGCTIFNNVGSDKNEEIDEETHYIAFCDEEGFAFGNVDQGWFFKRGFIKVVIE